MASAEQVVKDIRRQTRRHFSAEDKIRIECERCGRSGSYSMERASILFGDRARLPFILATVTAACAERQKHGGRCWAVFKGLPGQKVG